MQPTLALQSGLIPYVIVNEFKQENPQLDEHDYLKLILTARVYDVAIESPLTLAHNMTSQLGTRILLKREDMQPVFSFKLRGANNRMQQLSKSERERGVIACSAGNHAQGVALSAQKMGIKATIVMPLATPPIKWKNVKRMGAQVLLYGNDFDEAKGECKRIAKEQGITEIPPFDDPFVIAGQGTIALEIFRQCDPRDISAVFVCVGGGGLSAGISAYIKRIYPHIKVIGVEAFDAAAMTQSILEGERVDLNSVGLFADGAAVRSIGQETFKLCLNYLDGMILVNTDEICAAIKETFEDTRSILEPAGALGVAGCKKYLNYLKQGGKNVLGVDPTLACVAVCSGANMNFDRLRFVAERAELGENKEALVSVVVPEQPGSFIALYKAIYPRAVTEFAYRYGDPEQAHIFMSFALSCPSSPHSADELDTVLEGINQLGFKACDLRKNELAKTHARYLGGGRSAVPHERLFRFSFPERPGALSHFLTTLASSSPNSSARNQWNISLWHYRNYGGDVGNVVVGLQVPPETSDDFQHFLEQLGFEYVEETENQVFQQFLRSQS